jgi:hypothetical protein
MTDTEVLQRAIEIAISNGMPDPAIDFEDVQSILNADPYILPIKGLIYNHEFAKSLWPSGECLCGKQHNLGEVIVMKPGETTVHGQHRDWQYHLQQMVISEDPIDYIRKWLEGVK